MRKLDQQGLGFREGELAGSQQRVGELLACTDPAVLEGTGRCAHRLEVGQLPERGAVPQIDCGPQGVRRGRGRQLLGRGYPPLEFR
ncbi:MAG TPA: hypothetical protein VKI00_10320 [Mycobacterium sp.]|nr:hypothetical protein [Mycobacterium sp.]HME76022.1 hypothetical protein [Mycobacterium sp.]